MRAHTAELKKEIGILLPACPGSDEQLSMSHWTSLSGLEKKRVPTNFCLLFGQTSLNFFLPWAKLADNLTVLVSGQENHQIFIYSCPGWPDGTFYALSIWGKNVQLYKIRFYCSVLQLSSSVDSDSFFGPWEFKKADTRRQVSKT